MLRRLAIAGAMLIVSVPVGKAECSSWITPSKPSPISILCAVVGAMEEVESGGDPLAYNPKEEARGILQIRPIMVREINRICGTSYTNKDCFDPIIATIMFIRMQYATNRKLNPEKAARLWNGGYKWKSKESTLQYWNAVKGRMHGKKKV